MTAGQTSFGFRARTAEAFSNPLRSMRDIPLVLSARPGRKALGHD